MTISLRTTGVAIGAAVLVSATAAAGASAATITQVSYSAGTLTVQAASGQANLIAVSNSGSGYRIKDLGTGATLGYTAGGLTSISPVSSQEGVVTTSGTVTRVVVRAGDLDDSIVTNGLAQAATLSGGSGDDGLLGGPAGSNFDGGTGDDSVSGGSGNDVLTGNAGSDVIYGNGGNDTFFEYDGFVDNLYGGAGTDNAQVDGALDATTAIESVTFN